MLRSWSTSGTDRAQLVHTPVYLDIETDDVAGLFDRAVAAGATEIRAPTDPQLPVQAAKVRDPFGHIWLITRSGGGGAA